MRRMNTNPNALAKCLAVMPCRISAVLFFTVVILIFLQCENFLSCFRKNVTYRFVYATRCIYACVVTSFAKKYSLKMRY